MPEQQRYTLDEAEDELRRRDCEQQGHGPDVVVQEADGRAIKAYCRCGTTVWTPTDDQREGR